MIKSFNIHDLKTYDTNGETFDLKYQHKEGNITYTLAKKVNFFFGTNGSGKSSIKRFISEHTNMSDFDWSTNEKVLCFDEEFMQKTFKKKGTLAITAGRSDINDINKANEVITKYNNYSTSLVLFESGNIEIPKAVTGSELIFTGAFDNKINASKYKDFFLYEKKIFSSQWTTKGLPTQVAGKLADSLSDFSSKIDHDEDLSEENKKYLYELVTINKNVLLNAPLIWSCTIPCFYLYFSLTGKLEETRNNNLDPKRYKENNEFFDNVDRNKINALFNHFLKKQQEKIDDIIDRMNRLKSIKSPELIVNNINDYLAAQGFFDIRLELDLASGISNSKANMHNLVVRRTFNDKTTDQFQELSEGEKHILAFLYFYYTCIGYDNYNEALNPKDKIIIIDDPITSMDSNAIFLVSNLICDLFKYKRDNKNNYAFIPTIQDFEFEHESIKQGFILTHNGFFLKELLYRIKFSEKKMSLWHIYKTIETSKTQDPISGEDIVARKYVSHKTTLDSFKDEYSLLWDTLLNLKNETDEGTIRIVIPNICRRILESYGKFEGLDDGDSASKIIDELDKQIIDKLQEEEKHIYKSFIASLNTGSHYISPTDELNTQKVCTNYLKIFKMIFKRMDPRHYYLKTNEDIENDPLI